MKNLKLTQSLNQNVGIEIEETGLRPGTPGGPTCGQGALACWNCEICKIKDLFGELWNFLGDSGRKLVLWKMLGTFVFGNITSPPHSRTFSGKENVFEGALLGKGAPIF
jgi:hypothetical protein